MRTLVTGAAGFVGSAIAQACLARGDEVLALDDLSTGLRKSLPLDPSLRFTKGSVTDATLVAELVSLSDRVFHAAGTANPDAAAAALLLDVTGAETVMAACERFETPLLIPSAADVYGAADRPYARETDRVALPAPRGDGCFAAGKLMIEAAALHRAAAGRLSVVVARLFDVVGPETRGRRWLAQLLDEARRGVALTVPGSGTQRRTIMHVEDAARTLIDLLDAPSARGRIINVGADEEVSLLEVARRIKQLTRSRAPIVRAACGLTDELLVQRRVPCLARLRATVRPTMRSVDRVLVACVAGLSPRRSSR